MSAIEGCPLKREVITLHYGPKKSSVIEKCPQTRGVHSERFHCSWVFLTGGSVCCHLLLARRFFYPEDGSDMFLRNAGSHTIYAAPHPRRRYSSFCNILNHGSPCSVNYIFKSVLCPKYNKHISRIYSK
jgi:hypothetical protein